MALEDFERQLAEEKEAERRRERRKEHHKSSEDSHHTSHRHHHHRNPRHRDSHYDNGDHRSKRSRHDNDKEGEYDEERRHRHRRKSRGEEDTRTEKREKQVEDQELKRDSWMEAPSAIDVDYIHRKQRREPSPPKSGSLGADLNLKIHKRELNQHLVDLSNGKIPEELDDTPNAHEDELDDSQAMHKKNSGEMVEQIAVPASSSTGPRFDQTALNKLKAQLMKAQLRKDTTQIEILQKQYDEAMAMSANTIGQDPTVVNLSAMDNRMLSSAPRNEVKSVQNRRGAERGQVEENEEMSIEDMVREERRNRGQQGGEGQRFAERIAKDAKFDNDLEYLDENANKLAKRVHKSDINLRNVAINEYQKLNKILENCPLCHHEDKDLPPAAPVVSLGTRTYLTLPTEPELSPQSTMIVPIQHHTNLLECDDDEWEELRNFMKSLTRLYHDQGRDVIFYENAAHPHRKPHAALTVIPLPYSLGETAPAFFKEAFLTTEDEWSQHKKIIDTLARSKPPSASASSVGKGWGKQSFRRSLAKEMPYFHVWFELDGGLGHIVEEPDRWPRGDLFAREIVGGMLGLEPDVVKRQGRWTRGAYTERVEAFRKRWRKFDWTRILTD